MDCRPPCVDGAPSSSSDDSRDIRRSDVVANGVVFFFGLLFRGTKRMRSTVTVSICIEPAVLEFVMAQDTGQQRNGGTSEQI